MEIFDDKISKVSSFVCLFSVRRRTLFSGFLDLTCTVLIQSIYEWMNIRTHNLKALLLLLLLLAPTPQFNYFYYYFYWQLLHMLWAKKLKCGQPLKTLGCEGSCAVAKRRSIINFTLDLNIVEFIFKTKIKIKSS